MEPFGLFLATLMAVFVAYPRLKRTELPTFSEDTKINLKPKLSLLQPTSPDVLNEDRAMAATLQYLPPELGPRLLDVAIQEPQLGPLYSP